MPKRFRETNLNRKSWFRKLTPANKCIWNFLCDECDIAGVWEIDTEALEFNIGTEINLDEFITAVNKDKIRVERFGADKLFLPSFVEFQYGTLSEKCVPHQKVISLLVKYDLLGRVLGRVDSGVETTPKEEEEDKEEEKDKDERGSGGKQNRKPNFGVRSRQPEFKNEYDQLVENVKLEPDPGKQKLAIAEFITTNRPKFPEPYADLWNLSLQRYGISQVESISDGRLKKFNTRIKEPPFDFIAILTAINKSEYLKGKTTDWKVDWDWVFENDTNYLKIIEGKYS